MLTWQKNNLFQGKQIYLKRELEILYQFVNLTNYTNIAVFSFYIEDKFHNLCT